MAQDKHYFDNTGGTEFFAKISQNRTLFVEHLTTESSVRPQVVYGLQTIDQVFDYYKPQVIVNVADTDGGMVEETILFNSIDCFNVLAIAKKSKATQQLQDRRDAAYEALHQLQKNQSLNKLLEDDEGKASFTTLVDLLIEALESDKIS